MFGRLASLLAAVGLSACVSYTPQDVANPKDITIKDAFISVAEGLEAFQDSLNKRPDFHLGVIACRIIVKFNISATAARGGSVGAEASFPAQFVRAKLSGQQNNNSTGDRGNIVEVDLNSIDTRVCPPISQTKQDEDAKPKK